MSLAHHGLPNRRHSGRYNNVPSAAGLSGRAAGDNQAGEEKNHGGGKQAVTTEGVNDEGLVVEEPECNREHRPDGDQQEPADSCVAEGGEDGETENSEVGDGAEERERDAANVRESAAQDLKAVGRSAANHGLTTKRLGREVGCIRQSR